MKNDSRKYRGVAVLAVLLMVISSFGVIETASEDSDASSDSWTCTITVTDSNIVTKYAKNGATLSDTTPVSGNNGNASVGSWGFDSDGYGPFGSYYIAVDKDTGKIYAHLDPSDLSKTMKGESISASQYNIMWVLPKVYMKVSGSTLTLSNEGISDDAPAHTIKLSDGKTETYNFLAIGVYEAQLADNKVYSISGVTPTVSTGIADFQTAAAKTSIEGGKSMIWNFYQWQLYRFCSLAVMENFDSQTQIGYGNASGSIQPTGTTIANGPYYGTTSASTAGERLFIENAWGNVYDYIGDAYWSNGLYAGQNKTQVAGTTNGLSLTSVKTGLSGYGTYPYSTSLDSWGLPTATGSSSTTAPDYIYSGTSGAAVRVGGDWGYASIAGLSCLADGFVGGYSYNGSRLAMVFDADSAATPTVTYDHGALTDMGGDATGLATSGKIEGDAIYPDLNDSTLAAMQDGYKHIGWYVDGTFVAIGTTVTKTTSHTAYSAWMAPQITITFYAEGEVYATLAVPKGTAGVVLTPVMVEGVFEGWYTDSAFQNKYDGTQKFNENTDLYAKGVPPLVFTSVPTATASIANVTANMYYFDATDSTGRYAIEWDFGDGNTSTDPIAYNTYTDPGHYTVTLKITNLYGDTDTKTYGIDVGDVKEQTDAPSKIPAIIGIFAVIVLSALVVRRFV